MLALPTSSDLQLTPVKALVAAATAVSCGVDFTVWIADGKAMAAGNPQVIPCTRTLHNN